MKLVIRLIYDLAEVSDAQVPGTAGRVVLLSCAAGLGWVLHAREYEVEEAPDLDSADRCLHVGEHLLELLALEVA